MASPLALVFASVSVWASALAFAAAPALAAVSAALALSCFLAGAGSGVLPLSSLPSTSILSCAAASPPAALSPAAPLAAGAFEAGAVAEGAPLPSAGASGFVATGGRFPKMISSTAPGSCGFSVHAAGPSAKAASSLSASSFVLKRPTMRQFCL